MRASSPATGIDDFLGFLGRLPFEPEPEPWEGAAPPPPLAARARARCFIVPCGPEAGGPGVMAGPGTNGSLRRRAPPCLPSISTGAAAALLGHKISTSRANRLLRTDAMLHSRDSPCHAEEE